MRLRPLLGPFCAVLRASATAVLNAHGVQGAPYDVVTDARYVLNPSASYEHNRVFLQVVADSRNISCDLYPVGQPYPCNFPQGGVGLLGSHGVDPGADATTLRASLQGGRRGLGSRPCAPLFHQLTYGGQFRLPLLWLVFPLALGILPSTRYSNCPLWAQKLSILITLCFVKQIFQPRPARHHLSARFPPAGAAWRTAAVRPLSSGLYRISTRCPPV